MSNADNPLFPDWETTELDRLHSLWVKTPKLSASAIGKILNRSRSAVLGRVHRIRSREGVHRWPYRRN